MLVNHLLCGIVSDIKTQSLKFSRKNTYTQLTTHDPLIPSKLLDWWQVPPHHDSICDPMTQGQGQDHLSSHRHWVYWFAIQHLPLKIRSKPFVKRATPQFPQWDFVLLKSPERFSRRFETKIVAAIFFGGIFDYQEWAHHDPSMGHVSHKW